MIIVRATHPATQVLTGPHAGLVRAIITIGSEEDREEVPPAIVKAAENKVHVLRVSFEEDFKQDVEDTVEFLQEELTRMPDGGVLLVHDAMGYRDSAAIALCAWSMLLKPGPKAGNALLRDCPNAWPTLRLVTAFDEMLEFNDRMLNIAERIDARRREEAEGRKKAQAAAAEAAKNPGKSKKDKTEGGVLARIFAAAER